MRRIETWLTGLLWVAVAVLLPMAVFEPMGSAAATVGPGFALGACPDGSAHLVMGCASIQL